MNLLHSCAWISALCGGAKAGDVTRSRMDKCEPAWPDLPLITSGRDILGASGQKIVFKGVNWPGAAEALIPEGLQYASVSNIAGRIKSLGFNVVRLTYAIQMIDDHLSGNPNSTLENTLGKALGATNGSRILAQILERNPQFTAKTTRLEVFDAVADALAQEQIYVHLDNHQSTGEWCCSPFNGNAWFGDFKFPVYNWQRGLGFMASHTKSWKGLSSLSLRNELRPALLTGLITAQPYNWVTWYNNMVPAAHIVHGNNSDALVFFSGLNWDKDCSKLVNKESLGLINGPYFNPSTYDFANKLIVELHNYQNDAKSCDEINNDIYKNAYGAMHPEDDGFYHVPIVLTEFGFDNTDGSYQKPYAQCLKDYVRSIPSGPGGWMQWVLAGSYYIREGTQDSNEAWGLFNHDWSDWRNQTVIDQYVKPWIAATN